MANTKEVSIYGEVPFNWLDDVQYDGELTEKDKAFLAGLFMSPSNGLYLSFREGDIRRNAKGGRTSYYDFEIHGHEALSTIALGRLVFILDKAGIVQEARLRDLDNQGDWEPISYSWYTEWCDHAGKPYS